MVCDYVFCIYNENNECVLSDISISESGVCSECILPNIDNETLEKLKQVTREKLK